MPKSHKRVGQNKINKTMRKSLLVILAIVCGTIYSDTYSENSNAEIYKELLRLHREIEGLTDRVRALEDVVKTSSEYNDAAPIIDVPCMEEAYDTETEYGEIGIAEAPTQQKAKEKAIRLACESLAIKIYPEMISYYYVETKDKTESKIENHITETQIQIINSLFKRICCNYKQKPTGFYEAFVAVRISKTAIKKNNP